MIAGQLLWTDVRCRVSSHVQSHVISSYDETRTGREAEAERVAFFFALGEGRIDRVGVSGPYPERIRVSENSHTVDLSARSS